MELTGIKLSDCPSMDDYIGRTLEAWKRCKDAKVEISDRVVALLLLGTLGPEYQPFIMGLTASGQAVSIENVKSSLLSLVPKACKSGETAFLGSGRGNARSSTNKGLRNSIQFFNCNGIGHYARQCPKCANKEDSPVVGGSKRMIYRFRGVSALDPPP